MGMSKSWWNRKEVKKSIKPTPSDKLMERIRKELGFPISPEAKIVRTGASREWRGSGRWQWVVKDPNTNYSIGSDTGVRDLLKSKYLDIDMYAGGRILGLDYQP